MKGGIKGREEKERERKKDEKQRTRKNSTKVGIEEKRVTLARRYKERIEGKLISYGSSGRTFGCPKEKKCDQKRRLMTFA